MSLRNWIVAAFLAALMAVPFVASSQNGAPTNHVSERSPDDRKEVVFWHFWGGGDRNVVDDVARRFNQSQSEYWVRPVAMPGNNLQAKLFLSVAGGDPPDLVNQDDPILADWAQRGIISPMTEHASEAEVRAVRQWLFNSAERLSVFDDQMFGVCNGLDIRALYYNQTVLEKHELEPPKTIEALSHIATTIAPPTSELLPKYAYLPDSRRLWAWGYVWNGKFYDESDGTVAVATPEISAALSWMQSFSTKYGEDNLVAFRQGDQSLPGKTFPLLPMESDSMQGRYSLVMDGQWRVRDLAAFQTKRSEQGIPAPKFGVCPLPSPDGGRINAGWVNGNFFVIPQGAPNGKGAWEFIKFWIGYQDANEAAKTCAAGGWIPVSQTVVESPPFQEFLSQQPLFSKFVELANSENQFPVPQVPGAAMFRRTVESAAYEAVTNPKANVDTILQRAEKEIQQHLLRSKK